MRKTLAAMFVLAFIFTLWQAAEPAAAGRPAAPDGAPTSEGHAAVRHADGDGGWGEVRITGDTPKAEGFAASSLRWGLAGS